MNSALYRSALMLLSTPLIYAFQCDREGSDQRNTWQVRDRPITSHDCVSSRVPQQQLPPASEMQITTTRPSSPSHVADIDKGSFPGWEYLFRMCSIGNSRTIQFFASTTILCQVKYIYSACPLQMLPPRNPRGSTISRSTT